MDACFVPSERLLTLAGKCGLAPDQIRLHGLPIRSGFSREQPAEKTELQVKLGLKQGVKTCLVMGGGDGVGRLEGIAESLGHRLGQEKRETQVGGRGAGAGEAGSRRGGWTNRYIHIGRTKVPTAITVIV